MIPSVFWSAPVPSEATHPHNMLLHGVLQFPVLTFFLETYWWSLRPNSYTFVWSDQRIFLQKVKSFPPCAHANSIGICFTLDIDTCLTVSSSIFRRSFDVVLGFICTFLTKICSSLGDRMHLLPEQYDGCIVQGYLYLHTHEFGIFRHLEIAPNDKPDFFFLRSGLISFDFPMISSKEALSLKVALKIQSIRS